MHAENAVAGKVERKQQPPSMSILGNVSDATLLALMWVKVVDATAFKEHLALRCSTQTGQNLYELGLPVAFDPCNSKSLSAAYLEGHPVQNRISFGAPQCKPAYT